MPRSMILTNHKGGVGKSTSAANIAIGIVTMLKHFSVPNTRVLLIDTDSQAHASLITTGRHDFGVEDSLYTVLMADRKNAPQVMADWIVASTRDPDLHVLPGSILLEGAERELMGVAGAPFRIADPLNYLASHYAAIMIDTRPSFSTIPCFHSVPLDWNSYERLLPSESIARRIGLNMRGLFIEDERGKRDPASIGVAQKVMAQRQQLTLKQRTFSHYCYEIRLEQGLPLRVYLLLQQGESAHRPHTVAGLWANDGWFWVARLA